MNEENNQVVFRRNAAFRFIMLATILLLSVTGCGKGLNADAGKKDSVSTDTGAGMAKTAEKVMEPEPAGDSQAADLTDEQTDGADQDNTAEPGTSENDNKESTDSDTAIPEAASEAPEYVRAFLSFYEFRERNQVINHEVQQLELAPDHGGEFTALEERISQVNRTLVDAENRSRASELEELDSMDTEKLQELLEEGLLSNNESWKIYPRRTDSRILSFITEYRAQSHVEEVDYIEVSGYNYRVDT